MKHQKKNSILSKIKSQIKLSESVTAEDFENHAAGDYDVILIESYKEFHAKFSGDKTGYNGRFEWCPSNSKSNYNDWTKRGTKQFFVLAKKGWENIQPPDPNTTNAYDEYGTSLIAILVEVKDCELLYATLRWNYIIDPSDTVPKARVNKAFLSWEDLSKAVGFNVKTIVEKDIKEYQNELQNKIENINNKILAKLKTVTEITRSTLTQVEKQFITRLNIPVGVTNIGGWAFWGCSDLTAITIPDSVKSIGKYAFKGCSGLTNITIPDSVTSIGYGAFNHCSGLTNITIPDTVTSVGEGAFYGCEGLTGVTIGNSVTSIGGWTFWDCQGLTSVTIPDSIISIGDYAFYNCNSLTSIKIPDSVISIGNSAFKGCSGLTSVTFEGKTLDEVKAMEGYPWGILDPENIITASLS